MPLTPPDPPMMVNWSQARIHVERLKTERPEQVVDIPTSGGMGWDKLN